MKKQIIISSFIAAAILGGTAILSVAKAESPRENIIANNSTLEVKNPLLAHTGTETVYAISDENGNVKSKFIGSTIYTGAEELPFTMKTTYYLNGTEISTAELAGKSGHVKIVFNYESVDKKNGSFIPFLALTTLNLDYSKFSNVKLSNGEIFNENNSTYTIIGYALTGLNKNLGTDFLPDTFVFEADTTNFKMVDTYTIFMNDILGNIDLSELNRLDDLKNAIYKLEDGINKLVSGATDLSNGIAKTIDGTKALYAGSQKLVNGLNELNSNNEEIINGAEKIKAMAPTMISLMQEKKTNLEEQLETIPDAPEYAAIRIQIITNITKLAYALEQMSSISDFYDGLLLYTNGVSSATAGAKELSNGINTLLEGENQLHQGSTTLKDGLSIFKTSGIDKLVNFANKDLNNFTRNLKNSVSAASSYKSFGGVEAKSVKFIIKTPSI